MEKAEVIAEYNAKSSNELSVRIGERVEIIDKKFDSSGLWKVIIQEYMRGRVSYSVYYGCANTLRINLYPCKL